MASLHRPPFACVGKLGCGCGGRAGLLTEIEQTICMVTFKKLRRCSELHLLSPTGALQAFTGPNSLSSPRARSVFAKQILCMVIFMRRWGGLWLFCLSPTDALRSFLPAPPPFLPPGPGALCEQTICMVTFEMASGYGLGYIVCLPRTSSNSPLVPGAERSVSRQFAW